MNGHLCAPFAPFVSFRQAGKKEWISGKGAQPKGSDVSILCHLVLRCECDFLMFPLTKICALRNEWFNVPERELSTAPYFCRFFSPLCVNARDSTLPLFPNPRLSAGQDRDPEGIKVLAVFEQLPRGLSEAHLRA